MCLKALNSLHAIMVVKGGKKILNTVLQPGVNATSTDEATKFVVASFGK